MREIWVADSETDPFKSDRVPLPFIWGCCNGDDYHEFTETADFVDFIKTKDCIVYAHNGGKFDWFFIFQWLEPFEPISIISGRLAKFKIGLAEFRDSYNILPVPLSAYKKDDIDYAIFEKEERHKPENWRAIRTYLKSDCFYLHEFVMSFLDEYGLNLTVAGAAMKQWQKIAKQPSPHTSADFYDSIKPFYFGGRVEVFKPGIVEKQFKIIDINSAYPHAMNHLHPYGSKYNVIDKMPSSRKYIERCFLHLRCTSLGALPYRTKTGLAFPNSPVPNEFYCSGWEYLAGLETGTINDIEIIDVIQFQDSITFGDYVSHFYELKEKAEKGSPEYIFAKLFLNSLYGKFGANPENYDEYTIVPPENITAAKEVDDYDYCAELGPWALVSKPLEEHKRHYYNVATAASITGFVRAMLWRAINQCEGVIYCDTDSIVCASSGDLELHTTNIGAWDTEATCEYGAFAGKKLYAAKTTKGTWKTASKGVRLSAEEIVRIAKGERIVHTPENPSFSLKRGVKFISREIVATTTK